MCVPVMLAFPWYIISFPRITATPPHCTVAGDAHYPSILMYISIIFINASNFIILLFPSAGRVSAGSSTRVSPGAPRHVLLLPEAEFGVGGGPAEGD